MSPGRDSAFEARVRPRCCRRGRVAATCRLDAAQLEMRQAHLDAGPAVHGWSPQVPVHHAAERDDEVVAAWVHPGSAGGGQGVGAAPYAPDLNPVEGVWSQLKRALVNSGGRASAKSRDARFLIM